MGPLARAGLLLCLLVAAGCGSGTGGGDAAEPPSQPRYDLQITYWPEGKDGESRTATLTCDPNGGTHPDPAKACAALDAHPEALHPVPGGHGLHRDLRRRPGAPGSRDPDSTANFNRSNGCEIARWDALAPVLELPG